MLFGFFRHDLIFTKFVKKKNKLHKFTRETKNYWTNVKFVHKLITKESKCFLWYDASYEQKNILKTIVFAYVL